MKPRKQLCILCLEDNSGRRDAHHFGDKGKKITPIKTNEPKWKLVFADSHHFCQVQLVFVDGRDCWLSSKKFCERRAVC